MTSSFRGDLSLSIQYLSQQRDGIGGEQDLRANVTLGGGAVILLLDPWNSLGKNKFSDNQGQTSRAPVQIATPWVPVNRYEPAPILTESPTWQQDNGSKPIVAGFCLCQKRKKKQSLLPKASELFALLRNLINIVQ